MAVVATRYEKACADLMRQKGKQAEGARLEKLFKLDWDYRMSEYPEAATYVGYPGFNDRWTDVSSDAIERRKRESQARLKTVQTFDRKKLPESERLNFDLFKRAAEETVEAIRFPSEFLALSQLSGLQQFVPQTLAVMPTGTVAQAEDLLKRLRAVPKLIDQTIALLREGLKSGVTPPQITLRDVPDQVKNQIVDPDKSAMLRPLRQLPDSLPVEQRQALLKDGVAIFTAEIVPALRKLHDFLVKDYVPGARKTLGWSSLPDGAAWYAFSAKVSTTTTLSPQQIHDIGQSEVKRIHAEMEKLIQSTNYQGSFKDFSKFLRTDSQFYFQKPEELLNAYRDICKRVDPQLIKLFGKLPRLTYGVLPVPSYAEKDQTTAYYEQGSLRSGRAGYFYANTYDLKTRPKWEMEALSLHEAVPGHHLQIALAEEIDGVPEFRRYDGYTAFIEGWGLYAESLGKDLGLYQDAYSKFGQLTYEMWRAVRLVVDTGIHSLGWTRDQALDFFRQNTAKSEHDMEVEVDRYIVWAGQALAYKIGQMRITSLREHARQTLGERFDVRRFHDVVLKEGAVPLDILESQVKEWVTTEKSRKIKRPSSNDARG